MPENVPETESPAGVIQWGQGEAQPANLAEEVPTVGLPTVDSPGEAPGVPASTVVGYDLSCHKNNTDDHEGM